MSIPVFNLLPMLWIVREEDIADYARRKIKSAVSRFLALPKMPECAHRWADELQ